jgi:hypothetical protein
MANAVEESAFPRRQQQQVPSLRLHALLSGRNEKSCCGVS